MGRARPPIDRVWSGFFEPPYCRPLSHPLSQSSISPSILHTHPPSIPYLLSFILHRTSYIPYPGRSTKLYQQSILRKMMVWKQLFSRKIEPNLKSACPRLKIKSDIKNYQNFDVRCSEWSISERKIASPRHLFRLIFEKNRILLKSSQLFSGCFNQKNKGTFSSSIFIVV